MSEGGNKRGKKRPKSYYIKCANKKVKRSNVLDVGMKGFLITCNTHEKEAVRESYNLLNEYADAVYGPEVVSQRDQDDDSSANSDSEEDVEEALKKEVASMKKVAGTERRFQNVDTKAKNVIFIKTTVDSPCDLAHRILEDIAEKKAQKARYALRLLPITATCRAQLSDIEKLAKKIFEPVFSTPFGVGLQYTTVMKTRNNQKVNRNSVLPALSKIVREMNPLHHLCHDEPDFVLLVEIIGTVCCLSVVKDFFEFRKYNLHEVVKGKVDIREDSKHQDIEEITEAGKKEEGQESGELEEKEKRTDSGTDFESVLNDDKEVHVSKSAQEEGVMRGNKMVEADINKSTQEEENEQEKQEEDVKRDQMDAGTDSIENPSKIGTSTDRAKTDADCVVSALDQKDGIETSNIAGKSDCAELENSCGDTCKKHTAVETTENVEKCEEMSDDQQVGCGIKERHGSSISCIDSGTEKT